jgi:hypothetical protein
MARKFLVVAAVIALALTPRIAPAEAHGFGGGGFHGFRGGGFHDRSFHERREFRRDGLRFGGIFGGYYPGYYGFGPCYWTIYGTIACY